jgi:hypothetical protein
MHGIYSHTRSDQSEPTFAGIRPTDVPPFRAAQIVGARLALFVSLAHVKDRLKQGDGVFESGLENRPSVGEHRIGRYLSSISPLLSEYPPRGVTRKLLDDSIQARSIKGDVKKKYFPLDRRERRNSS